MCQAKDHELVKCAAYLGLDPTRRLEMAFKWILHFLCLKNHRKDECTLPDKPCGIDGCRYRHHQLLHGAEFKRDYQGAARRLKNKGKGSPSKDETYSNVVTTSCFLSEIIGGNLPTKREAAYYLRLVRVTLKPVGSRRSYSVVALVDGGCSRTIIDENLARQMGLPINLENMILNGIHGSFEEPMARVSLEFVPKHGPNKVIHSAITRRGLRMPGPEVVWKDWAEQNPPFDQIADQLENFKYEDIKIFLGLDVEDLVWPVEGERERYISEDGRFKAYNSRLGWTIAGPAVVDDETEEVDIMNMSCFVVTTDEPADEFAAQQEFIKAFRDFNELEAIGITASSDLYSPAERREQTRMEKAAVQLQNGHWEVPMLTKSFQYIPPTERQARHRLASLHRKLDQNPALKQKYVESIHKDLKCEYIEKKSLQEAAELRAGIHCFLPHFAVFHPDKLDKLRRVNDAKVMLNKFLNVGPRNLNPMLGVIFRFRMGKYAVNADVKEHFSQVAIPKYQQPLVAFLWHEDPKAEPDVYVNTRHIFGAACSPAVAIFALSKAAECDPLIKPIVESSFYMDDLYYSQNSRRKLQDRAIRIQQALHTGGSTSPSGCPTKKTSFAIGPLKSEPRS